MARIKVFRPDLDDIERLSYGKGATKKRGTGSRQVCHRLNRGERIQYELAKQASYLTLNGTGYRKNRKGSPLVNTFRQRCDALSQLCVIIAKRADIDTVIIDFSTLRVPNDECYVRSILEKVFKVKYRDLYDSLVGSCGNDCDVSTIISGEAIDIDALRTNPIWAIHERLLTVTCDRDVAKSLANDVINETFHFDDENPIDNLKVRASSTVLTSDGELNRNDILENGTNGDELLDDESTCSSAIDWDDI